MLQTESGISIGPLDVKIASEELGGCYILGCLENARLNVGRNMRPIICDNREAPVSYRPLDPSMSVSLSAKELTAINFAIAAGSGTTIVTGASIDQIVGDPTGNSTTAAPAEWHIVKLTGSAPWAFTVYTELKDLWATGSSGTVFTKATDFEVYTAANDNGDTAVTPAAWTILPTVAHATGGVDISDACLGKVDFTAVTDAAVSQWTWDASAAPFTINGTYPIVDGTVVHGDTVALIGLAYKHSSVKDGASAQIAAANRQQILLARTRVQPVFFKGVHMFDFNQKRMALIIRIWKAINMSGFGVGFDAQATRDMTLDMTFMGTNDKRNNPGSPIGNMEVIFATSDMTPELLLGA